MKKLLLSKKGQVQGMSVAILSLIFASIVLIFGLVMLQEIRDTSVVVALNETAFDKTNVTLVAMASFADFWEIIVLAIVISVVIGLLLVVFGGRQQR